MISLKQTVYFMPYTMLQILLKFQVVNYYEK